MDGVAVLAELHGLDAPVERRLGILDVLERIRLLLLVVYVQVDQLLGRPRRRRGNRPPCPKAESRGNSRLRFSAKRCAVFGMMQHRVNVMENVLPRDRLVVVVLLKVLQRKERNVLLSLLAVLVVGVEGKTIGCRAETRGRNQIRNQIGCDASRTDVRPSGSRTSSRCSPFGSSALETTRPWPGRSTNPCCVVEQLLVKGRYRLSQMAAGRKLKPRSRATRLQLQVSAPLDPFVTDEIVDILGQLLSVFRRLGLLAPPIQLGVVVVGELLDRFASRSASKS